VIGAVFQQNGIATVAPRIDTQRVRAIDGAISARVHGHAATPGSEAALRELIGGIASGSPHYGDLSPQLAAGTRAMLSDLQATMKPWGALRSVEFRGVDEKGWDQYVVRFERGAASWKIGLDSYGLIVGAQTHPEAN
jgi:bla regulator protein blaR1